MIIPFYPMIILLKLIDLAQFKVRFWDARLAGQSSENLQEIDEEMPGLAAFVFDDGFHFRNQLIGI